MHLDTITSLRELRTPAPRFPIAIGAMDWRDLVLVHWNVDPAHVRPLVPRELALDLLPDGRAVVSLVAFRTEGARPRLVPRFAGLDFAEVNVRTYVRARGHGRGVYFLSLDAASRAFALAGRTLLGLPYFHARLDHHHAGGSVGFHGRRTEGAAASLVLRVEPSAALGHERGFESFVHDRYAMYWVRGGLRCVNVRHAPLVPVRAHIGDLQESLTRAAGLDVHRSVPTAYYVERSEVSIFAPEHVSPVYGPADACLAAS